MSDKLRDQINELIRDEIQDVINDYVDAQEYLIDYFRTKVSDRNCETFMLGRK